MKPLGACIKAPKLVPYCLCCALPFMLEFFQTVSAAKLANTNTIILRTKKMQLFYFYICSLKKTLWL
jgi:hypothetical protein